MSSAVGRVPATTATTGCCVTARQARQARHDEDRATYAHLSPSMFRFDPSDDDPFD